MGWKEVLGAEGVAWGKVSEPRRVRRASPQRNGSTRSGLEHSRVRTSTWEGNLKPTVGSPRGVSRHAMRTGGDDSLNVLRKIPCGGLRRQQPNGGCYSPSQVRKAFTHWWGRGGSKQTRTEA